MSPALAIPGPFAADIEAREGRPGRAWLRRLPRLVAALCDDWRVTPEGPTWYGYCAVALPVRDENGDPAVLKVSWAGPDQAPEAPTLRAWSGDGAVRLLRHDPDRWALLLERLDERRDLTGEPLDEAIHTIGRLLARLHRAPPPSEVPTLARVSRTWADRLAYYWPAEMPWSPRIRDEVVATCRELADDTDARLLHADLHFENVLAAEREPWLAIDPKGLVGDPAFEAWPVLWNRFEEYAEPSDVARRLDAWCEAARIDRHRARAWARARTVEDAADRLATASGDERDVSVHRFLLDGLPAGS